MTDYFLEDEDVLVYVPFIINDEYVVPDTDSVTYTLRDNDGTAVTGQIDIPVSTGASQTSISITIDAAYNTKDAEKYFENRILNVKGTSDAKPFNLNFLYRLTEALPVLLDPENVRNILGVSLSELPDADIDVYKNYFTLLDQYGDDFKTALVSGGPPALFSEAAIYLSTAKILIPSLKLRVAQLETDGVVRFSRFANIDWEALSDEISEQLVEAIENVGVATVEALELGEFGSSTDYFPR